MFFVKKRLGKKLKILRALKKFHRPGLQSQNVEKHCSCWYFLSPPSLFELSNFGLCLHPALQNNLKVEGPIAFDIAFGFQKSSNS